MKEEKNNIEEIESFNVTNEAENIPKEEVKLENSNDLNEKESGLKIEKSSIEENIDKESKDEKDKKDLGSNEFKRVDYVPTEKKSHKKLIAGIILIIFFLAFSTIFAILNINNNNIIKGIYIENIDFSNLSSQEAGEIISQKEANITDIELTTDDYETIAKLEELGITIDYKNILEQVMNFGRSNNIIIDNYSILKATWITETKS